MRMVATCGASPCVWLVSGTWGVACALGHLTLPLPRSQTPQKRMKDARVEVRGVLTCGALMAGLEWGVEGEGAE